MRFQEAIRQGEFAVTVELIPGRGAVEPSLEALVATAKRLMETGRVHAVSVTDAPGGNPALSAPAFASELVREGVEPLVHLSCKDRNRNQLEAELYAMQRAGVENLLCMTGDYPVTGWQGRPRPVFDLDSVTLLQQVRSFNAGMGYAGPKGNVVRTAPGSFYAGGVISPAKYTEAETLLQLAKAKKKVFAGAEFLVSQVCFDVRKVQEMQQLVRDADLRTPDGRPVPLIANIFVLTAPTAAIMNRGGIPGCHVGDALLAKVREERENSTDKGKEARLIRAAKMTAAARAFGYAGVHIGGFGVDEQAVCRILDLAECFGSVDVREFAEDLVDAPLDAWWAYLPDHDSGGTLASQTPAPRNEKRTDREVQGNFATSLRFHKLVFVPGKGLNRAFLAKERKLEEKKGRLRKHGLEHLSKTKLYNCIDCGDCGLYATAYTCPMAECPKCQRNGACGGSMDGWCEVYPGEKLCVWYKAYHRLKLRGDVKTLESYVVPPNDWSLFGKSPWGAMATGRDGYARREWLPDAEPDAEARDGVPPSPDAPRVL